LKAIRIGFNNTERAAPDRSGRAQDGDAFHAKARGQDVYFTRERDESVIKTELPSVMHGRSIIREPSNTE